MWKNSLNLVLLLGVILFAVETSFAQTRVIFQLNLKQEMKDSVFVPSEHSIVITGDKRPFSRTRTFEMEDKSPIDSIFTAEVDFPSSVMGETLRYNYVIKREIGDLEEFRPRLLPLKERNRLILNVMFFNDFAM